MSARPCVYLVVAVLSVFALAAEAREHGRPRDAAMITAIVIHTIGGPSCIGKVVQFRPIPKRTDDAEFWQRIMLRAPVADAHLVIGRSGTVKEVISLGEIANHAIGVNDRSIGIELVHRGDGKEPFEEAQIEKLIEVIKDLRRRFPAITLDNIVAHSDVDQQTCQCGLVTYPRRQDPGANFPIGRVLEAVRLPSDPAERKITLPTLTGPSSREYCPIF